MPAFIKDEMEGQTHPLVEEASTTAKGPEDYRHQWRQFSISKETEVESETE